MRLLLGSGGMRTDERREAWNAALDAFLGPVRRVLFVPFAVADHDAATEIVAARFGAGREYVGIHTQPDLAAAVAGADAVFVTGGNSFRLLWETQRHDLLGPIRDRVAAGMPYIGVSAGTNLACPTIKTTNDMPIVRSPRSTRWR
jgi:dipeptidase E